jgi:hypothetical protein
MLKNVRNPTATIRKDPTKIPNCRITLGKPIIPTPMIVLATVTAPPSTDSYGFTSSGFVNSVITVAFYLEFRSSIILQNLITNA